VPDGKDMHGLLKVLSWIAVLKLNENYPKIRKDVLDKARQMLRS